MFGRFKIVLASCVLSAAMGCGDGPATSQAVTPRDEKSFGPTAGQHALGANPEAELARMKKAAAAGAAPTQGRMPGR